MVIHRNGWLYRWTYLLSSSWSRPDQISLCSFFWRAFLWMPLFWLTVGSGAALVLAGVWFILRHRMFWIALPWALVWALFMYITRKDGPANIKLADFTKQVKSSVFWQGLKAVKGRFCPIIRFEDK